MRFCNDTSIQHTIKDLYGIVGKAETRQNRIEYAWALIREKSRKDLF